MLAINGLDIHFNSESFSEIVYEDNNNKLFQDDGLVNSIGRRSKGNENLLSHQSNNTLSMAAFNILQSSFFSSPNDQNHSFLTSTVN